MAQCHDDIIFNIFYISMILCRIVQLQRERDIQGHICKVSQRFGLAAAVSELSSLSCKRDVCSAAEAFSQQSVDVRHGEIQEETLLS